jgi:hypothetical protein
VREKYCWLVAGGWFVLIEKYCWLVADKPNEQGAFLLSGAAGESRDREFGMGERRRGREDRESGRDKVWNFLFLPLFVFNNYKLAPGIFKGISNVNRVTEEFQIILLRDGTRHSRW